MSKRRNAVSCFHSSLWLHTIDYRLLVTNLSINTLRKFLSSTLFPSWKSMWVQIRIQKLKLNSIYILNYKRRKMVTKLLEIPRYYPPYIINQRSYRSIAENERAIVSREMNNAPSNFPYHQHQLFYSTEQLNLDLLTSRRKRGFPKTTHQANFTAISSSSYSRFFRNGDDTGLLSIHATIPRL